MNPGTVLAQEDAVVHAHVNIIEDGHVQHSVALACVEGLFLVGAKKDTAIDAHIVLRILQILQQQLAEDLLLQGQVGITLQIELNHVLLVVVVVVVVVIWLA